MEMMSCPNLAVPAEVMQHVVNVESSRNPFAIGVVGAQLVRQPQNLDEAVATVRMLEDKGYNYSLGVAQVNRANFGKFGLDSYEKAFDVCPNLVAGSQILAQCYASAGGDWGKAFSCYYSGNFTTGYQDGYVQKVFASMARQAIAANASPIPIQLINNGASKAANRGTPLIRTDDGAYRVAMRSVADAALSAAIAPAVASAAGVNGPAPAGFVVGTDPATATLLAQVASPTFANPQGSPTGRIPTDPATAAAMAQVGMQIPNSAGPVAGAIATDPATAAVMAQIGISANAAGNAPAAASGSNGIFVPEVHGPNDPPPSAAAPPANAAPAVPGRDQADLRQGGGDGAFVF
jgi:type IV secretion system protein VirB1